MLACIGGLKQLDSIDRRHWGLQVVPEEVYRHERTLEELSLDFNGIQELPPVSWAGAKGVYSNGKVHCVALPVQCLLVYTTLYCLLIKKKT